ncbi:ATP-binding protein [Methylibium rhizosphaerae]|uniref:ATP-binding protein n=1 Tax=Methylibium rhizosphaerae TaxID=2570323 RepID=UPI00112B3D15|nr:ATP-binding protein [Methylibium rhizosphaerae]
MAVATPPCGAGDSKDFLPWLGLVLLLVGMVTPAWPAASALEAWRADAARVRTLAENNVPRAYEEARRLQASLPADATPADRARVLNLLSRAETYLGLTEEAAAHAGQAFELAARHGDRIGQAESDLNVALNAINQGRLDELVRATQHSVTVLEGVTDRPELLGEALLRTMVMYRRFEQYNEAAAIAVQAMEIARRSGQPLAMAFAYQGLAIAYDQSARPQEMVQHYQQMREQARAADSRLMEGLAISGLTGAALQRGAHVDGERLAREAVALFREVGAPYAEAFSLYGLAAHMARQKRYRQAIETVDLAMTIFRERPNRIGQWFGLNFISENRQAMGDVAGARAAAEEAYALARGLGIALYLSGSANRLADIAAAAGDYRRAYALRSEARAHTDNAARERASQRMAQLIRQYESEGKQRAIDELTRRNEQQTAELRQRELQQRWLWTVLAAVGLALAGTALFMHRLRLAHRRQVALNDQLLKSENDVRALNAELEQRVQARTAELRQQARYLRTLIDMLPMWAWFKDTHSRYLVVNQSHARARGHEVATMVGKTDQELLPGDLAERQLADDRDVMLSGQRKTAEEYVSSEAGAAWMETYKAPVLDEDGSLLGMVGVARNISDRKAAEAAREAALEEASRLARQRTEFLAQMSHELRTPLNGILGFAQILQRDRQLDERQARGLRIIEESGQHLLTLINDILDLARIDAAKLELYPGDVNLATFLQVVCDIVRVKADERRLMFHFESARDLPQAVRVDEKRLRQVLLNLLSNAIKFTDHGQVRLSVSKVAASAPGQARLRFEVHDSGIGMSESQLARLFRPFEQVGEARRREGGSGLGLAISRQLVRLMGGDIEVRSRPGEGSAFCFEIEAPVVVQHEPHQADTHAVPIGYEGGRRRLLVVDDVAQNRAVLTDALGMLGFETLEAADGAQALEVAQRSMPDLVVMDLTMPVMDGLEATRRLRARYGPGLPVIATSASVTPDSALHSREAGADLFIGKPIDQTVLLEAVARLLKLTWVLEPLAAAPAGEAAFDDAMLVPPPPAQIAVLQRLARTGNMRSICEEADRLKMLDPRYAAFAARLRSLAEGCQSRAIAALVQRYAIEQA